MPELPEVETITRKLKEKILGRKITSVSIENPKVIAYPDEKEFMTLLNLKVINNINRRGKYIIFDLTNELKLIAHMRMTGRLYVVPESEEVEKHTHVTITLDNNESLRFVDPRRFGRFWLVKNNELNSIVGLDKLGLEPLDSELTPEYLKEKLGNRKKAIKTLLLDQDVITGIGNIYADEILHRSRIYPGKKANELTDEEYSRLALAIPIIIQSNIDECWSKVDDKLHSLLDYRNSRTITTYNHQKQPCPDCGTPLERIKVNGRSTCYCPECQKAE